MLWSDFLTKVKEHKIHFTEEMLLERLLDKFRWPKNYPWGQPSIEIIDEGGQNQQYFFEKEGYLDPIKAIKAYEEGYTLILSNCGSLTKDTWIIQQMMNSYCKETVNINLYFGNGKKSLSFDKHSHEYNVLVKNIFGESEWIIDDNKHVLNNQNVLVIPKNVNHQVTKINSPKLSMTCNMGYEIG
jgi:mannose-6-phosphate isomerase-like protein (cupin superfamily)